MQVCVKFVVQQRLKTIEENQEEIKQMVQMIHDAVCTPGNEGAVSTSCDNTSESEESDSSTMSLSSDSEPERARKKKKGKTSRKSLKLKRNCKCNHLLRSCYILGKCLKNRFI